MKKILISVWVFTQVLALQAILPKELQIPQTPSNIKVRYSGLFDSIINNNTENFRTKIRKLFSKEQMISLKNGKVVRNQTAVTMWKKMRQELGNHLLWELLRQNNKNPHTFKFINFLFTINWHHLINPNEGMQEKKPTPLMISIAQTNMDDYKIRQVFVTMLNRKRGLLFNRIETPSLQKQMYAYLNYKDKQNRSVTSCMQKYNPLCNSNKLVKMFNTIIKNQKQPAPSISLKGNFITASSHDDFDFTPRSKKKLCLLIVVLGTVYYYFS